MDAAPASMDADPHGCKPHIRAQCLMCTPGCRPRAAMPHLYAWMQLETPHPCVETPHPWMQPPQPWMQTCRSPWMQTPHPGTMPHVYAWMQAESRHASSIRLDAAGDATSMCGDAASMDAAPAAMDADPHGCNPHEQCPRGGKGITALMPFSPRANLCESASHRF